MSKFFSYTRTQKVNKKDSEGKSIPETISVKQEDGSFKDEIVPGRFQTEEKEFLDIFNIDYVIRTHQLEDGDVVVLLNDGHEVTEKVPQLKNPAKKPPYGKNDIVEVKERQWVQSEILIKGADQVKKLYEALTNL